MKTKPTYLGGSRAQRWLPTFLAAILALPPSLLAQQPVVQQPPQPPESLPVVESLKVMPLAGNHAMNDLERRVMTPLVVQVLDQNSRPVEGAQVVFRFPLNGPRAEFSNQQPAQTVRTNADGQAAAVGWTAHEVGTFQVHVTASRGNELGETMLSMTNVNRVVGDGKEKQKTWWSNKWAKIAVIAGAAGVAAADVLLTRGRGKSTTTVTGIPGSPTIGGPQKGHAVRIYLSGPSFVSFAFRAAGHRSD